MKVLSRVGISMFAIVIFSVVNMYLDHLKLYVVCINGRRYVCCNECYVVANECDEPTYCLVQPIGVMYQYPIPILICFKMDLTINPISHRTSFNLKKANCDRYRKEIDDKLNN